MVGFVNLKFQNYIVLKQSIEPTIAGFNICILSLSPPVMSVTSSWKVSLL